MLMSVLIMNFINKISYLFFNNVLYLWHYFEHYIFINLEFMEDKAYRAWQSVFVHLLFLLNYLHLSALRRRQHEAAIDICNTIFVTI